MTGFAIDVVEEHKDHTALGVIQVGDFSERFELVTDHCSVEQYRQQWRAALFKLLNDASAVALMTWMAPSGVEYIRKAWILYREGSDVFVREMLFIPGEHPPVTFDDDGLMVVPPPRDITDEDGERPSEWQTTVPAVSEFLAAW